MRQPTANSPFNFIRILIAAGICLSCVFSDSNELRAQDSPQDAKAKSETKRGLQPEDFYKEVTIESSALSPDGSLLAFTVMTIEEDSNSRHREIWMQRLSDGKPDGEPYCFTSPASEASSPAWSPDGRLLSFRSQRGDDRNSVWFLRVTAPGGEAFHIEGVDSTPNWSPDGKWIAMTKRGEQDDDEEETDDEKDDSEPDVRGREGWISPQAVTKTLSKQRFDGRVITGMSYKRDGVSSLIPDRSDRVKNQLFIVSAKGGKPKQITETAFDVGNVVWNADSESLFFVGNELQDDEYNQDFTSEIYMVARGGGDHRKITNQMGAERGMAVSPDGKHMSYLFSPERGAETDVFVVELANGRFRGEPRNLTADWEYSPGGPMWIDDDTLRMTAQMHGNSHVFDITVGDGRLRQVTSGDRTLTAISQAKNADIISYASNDPTHVTELYLAAADGTGETKLTSFNEKWLSEVTLMPAERLTWTVADGTGVEGWLVKPVNYDPEKTYPMILKIHGGPHSAYGNYWFRTFHILSNSGFFVLYTNPRGSGGYGHTFTYATKDKWGELDSEDYLLGVDTALEKYPNIDPQRLGVSGGSYGGFMTNWLTATTDRFAAAVTSRSISNWNSWYGSSDAQGLTEYEFSGYPWETRDTYNRLSPLTYVENVTAPTLIIHSEEDYRTPITDAEQWYIALKKRQVPVEFVRYPRSSHGLSRTGEPWLLVDRLERLRSWFDHFLNEVE